MTSKVPAMTQTGTTWTSTTSSLSRTHSALLLLVPLYWGVQVVRPAPTPERITGCLAG